MKSAREKAMALADGKLLPTEVPGLVHDLYHDPDLVSEFQAFVATTAGRLAPAYQPIVQAPAPTRIVDLIMNYREEAPKTVAKSKPWSPRSAIQGLIGRLKDTYDGRGWSLATGPALAAGTVVAVCAWLLMPTSSVGAIVDADVGRALDRTASGTEASLVALSPILSFKNKSAELCRQYDLVFSARQASHAVACRNGAGEWKVVISTPPATIGKPVPAGPISRKPVNDYVNANSVEDLSTEREAEELGKRS